MTGQSLIDRVRRVLKDTPSLVEQGTFWSDNEILLALNIAMYVWINFCIKNNFTDDLSGIIKKSSILHSPTTLPPDYLHYISSTVGYDDFHQYISQIFLGGNADVYFRTKIVGTFIVNNQIWFTWNRDYKYSINANCMGFLYYFKYPNPIVTGNFDINFHDHIYMNTFIKHASVILGIKETKTTRDIKTYRRYLQSLLTMSVEDVIYRQKNREDNVQ
jgi:hypothetical protein